MAEEIVNTIACGHGNPSKLRSIVSWAVYVLGWAGWIFSMPMGLAYVDKFNDPGVPSHILIPILLILVVSPVALWPWAPVALILRLEVACYYFGLVSCIAWPVLRRKRGLMPMLARCGAFGLLAPWILMVELFGSTDHCLGLPFFTVSSTLICIGVWLIPPRRQKPASQNIRADVLPSSGLRRFLNRWFVLLAGWAFWALALFVPE